MDKMNPKEITAEARRKIVKAGRLHGIPSVEREIDAIIQTCIEKATEDLRAELSAAQAALRIQLGLESRAAASPATESEASWDDLELHPSNHPLGQPDSASTEKEWTETPDYLINRLETLAFRLRQSLMGRAYTKRENDAQMIEEQIIPRIKQLLAATPSGGDSASTGKPRIHNKAQG